MKLTFCHHTNQGTFFLLPALSINVGYCEGCGDVCAYAFTLDIGLWGFGFALIVQSHDH